MLLSIRVNQGHFYCNQLRILLKGCVVYKRNVVLLIITIVNIYVNFVLKALRFINISSKFMYNVEMGIFSYFLETKMLNVLHIQI